MSTDHCVLDSTAYPHILDLITLFSSRDTLLSFRATSRTFLKRVDDLLLSNRLVVAQDTSNPLVIHILSNRARLPAFASWALHDNTLSERHLNLEKLRCVDIVGPNIPSRLERLLSRNAPPLTIRTLRDPAGYDAYNTIPMGFAPTAHTIVRFTSLSHLLYTPQPLLACSQPALKRTVYNITLNPGHALHLHDGDCLAFPYLRRPWSPQVVYILSSGPPEVWVTAHAKAGEHFHDADALLNSIITVIVLELQANGVETIIVGIDALACMQGVHISRSLALAEDPQGVFLVRCAQLMQSIWKERDHGMIADSLKRIKFMSVEKYREMVGPEQAALDTCESG